MEKTLTHISSQASVEHHRASALVKYAWWNTIENEWYISNTKRDFMPKGSRLLLELECEHTTAPIRIASAQPSEGDILACIDSTRILVKKVNWA